MSPPRICVRFKLHLNVSVTAVKGNLCNLNTRKFCVAASWEFFWNLLIIGGFLQHLLTFLKSM